MLKNHHVHPQESVVEQIAEVLEKAGYDVKGFSDGEENVYNLYRISSLKDLAKYGQRRIIEKRSFLFLKNSFPSSLYLVKSGLVKTYKSDQFGKIFTTGIHSKDCIFGYLPLILDQPYKDSAVALEDSEVIVINKREFFSLLFSQTSLIRAFINIMCRDLDAMEENLLSLAYDTTRKRVAQTLLTLDKKLNPDGSANFAINLTRENLAHLVGVSTETLIRTLRNFYEGELIELSGRCVTRLDKEGLRKVG